MISVISIYKKANLTKKSKNYSEAIIGYKFPIDNLRYNKTIMLQSGYFDLKYKFLKDNFA